MKLHILYIITKLELGGAQKVCLFLAKGLKNLGHETFLLSGAHGPLKEQAQQIGTTIFLDDLVREVKGNALLKEIKCFFRLAHEIKKLKKQYPNLMVHTHSTKAGIMGRWAAWYAGIKIRVHTIHGYAFHPYQNKVMWSAIYLAELVTSCITTHFVCVSHTDAATGKKLFPRFTKKHSIIRAAVDWQQFCDAQKIEICTQKEIFIFGTVSCFKPQKNLVDLLRAFAYVHQHNPQTRLEIIGDGTGRKEIEQYIFTHNLQDKIILHGWQPSVAPLMQQWHAFALTSLWEGLPCAVVEARLLKLPVLCYDTGGINEIINHSNNGFLYKQGHWQELAQGMLKISYDQQLYAALRNYNDMLGDFNEKSMIFDHALLYISLSNLSNSIPRSSR